MLSWSSTTCLPTPYARGPIPPSLHVAHVGIVRTWPPRVACAGGVRSFMVEAGGVCPCAVARVVCAAQWPHRGPSHPSFVEGSLLFLFFLAQTKMSWRSLLTSQYSR